jgi:hypothetical protein
MDQNLLKIMTWLLFLGGLVGFVLALLKLFGGGTPVEYGVLGIGGGLWFVFAAITILIGHKTR